MLIFWVLAFLFFFFNDTATTEIYTLSLHDALPICLGLAVPDRDLRAFDLPGLPHPDRVTRADHRALKRGLAAGHVPGDRKSTRLNSSHGYISYAVFCLKKKIKTYISILISGTSHLQ